jgi:hypothetical protein
MINWADLTAGAGVLAVGVTMIIARNRIVRYNEKQLRFKSTAMDKPSNFFRAGAGQGASPMRSPGGVVLGGSIAVVVGVVSILQGIFR